MTTNRKKHIKHLKDDTKKIFRDNPQQYHTYKQLQKKIGKKKYTKDEIVGVVNRLFERGLLVKAKGDRFMWAAIPVLDGEITSESISSSSEKSPNAVKASNRAVKGSNRGAMAKNANLIEGVVDMTRTGTAYIVTKDPDQADIFVRNKDINRAFDGDTVKVAITRERPGRKPEGKIVEVIERSKSQFVGTIQRQKNHIFFVADSESVNVDFYIPANKAMKAPNGSKVVVKMQEWPLRKKSPIGHVLEILGDDPTDNNVVMRSILADKGFPLQFNPGTLKYVNGLSETIPEEEIAKRRDMREITTFTIDPADAKDFDDALSIQEVEKGIWEIGVHIADVSHYVRPGTAIDEEALERATSVYLVDRVSPMLPERLSNELCSLRPEEEKLCFSAIFQINNQAEVINEWFGRTIIYSDKRFTYEEAQEIIETKKGDYKKEILKLNVLAKKFRKKRFDNGAINFERQEVRFRLDENGKPIELYVKEMKESNKLIEEFMLLANKKVAGFITNYQKQKPTAYGVYRVHDQPDSEKLAKMATLANRLGYRIKFDEDPKNIAKTINRLMAKVKDKPGQRILESLAIRSMAKATYTTSNIGHYGLAFENYSHFTSPIRRYPDILVHRILQDCLDGKPRLKQAKLEEKCVHSSRMERKAMDAEWDSIRYKQAEYLQERLGQVFEGVISSVMSFGFFVELTENLCEGLVRVENLTDDSYIYDEEAYCFTGFRSKKRYQVGDTVNVLVAKADLIQRKVDFELI